MAARPARVQFRTQHADLQVQITDDGSHTLLRADGATYHSSSGAFSETQHVYLHNSGVQGRLVRKLPTSVLEIGLGTGFAMLLTLDQAIATGASLRYVGLEFNWLPSSLLGLLQMERTMIDKPLVQRYLNWRAPLGEPVATGSYQWNVDESRSVCVRVGDAGALIPTIEPSFDAIYFDPFAPNCNVELWKSNVFVGLRKLLNPNGCLVTYSVSRNVREAMTRAGFVVRRVPGPKGGKREVLVSRPCVASGIED